MSSTSTLLSVTDCIEVLNACSSKLISNLLGGDHCTYWVAIANWLAESDNVRIHI